ncbi:MAG: hypothetical protein NUV65_04360 [Candidatus Roizmanbacteria bacterium]|nr:hypothetical protein [Candidatus Roizmanbacteria bacterium]
MAQPTFHTLEPQKQYEPISKRKNSSIFPIVVIVILACVTGSLSGVAVANYRVSSKTQTTGVEMKQGTGVNKNAFGTKNEKRFPDAAEGLLKKGGVEGEGTHHLERKGGPSQNVYLTSSAVNLDQFVNKKVKVWGKTYSAQTAGWLMDVGYLELQ